MDALGMFGLQAGVADGNEETFDGQSMPVGTHLRWSFRPELGFPSGGFWLYRRVSTTDSRHHFVPPLDIWRTADDFGHSASVSGIPSEPPAAGQTGSTPSTQVGPPTAPPQTDPQAPASTNGSVTASGVRHQEGHPLPWRPQRHEWHARLAERAHGIRVTGVAAEDVDEVMLETYVHVSELTTVLTARNRVSVSMHREFTVAVEAVAISAVRVVGATEIIGSECAVIDPPRYHPHEHHRHRRDDDDDDGDKGDHDDDATGGNGRGGGTHSSGGTGGTGGTGSTGGPGGAGGSGGSGGGGAGGSTGGGGSAGGGGSGGGTQGTGGSGGGGSTGGSTGVYWGRPDDTGWQRLSVEFTLPVTVASWPPRYPNAPLPTDPNVATRDVAEAKRRLIGRALDPQQPGHDHSQLTGLRAYLHDLVSPWPATRNYNVSLPNSPDGAHAPQLGIGRVEQLLINAFNPHVARVLGIGWVDTTAALDVEYEYTVAGVWGREDAAPRCVTPGLAPSASLARGYARLGGAAIAAAGASPLNDPNTVSASPLASMWRWIRQPAAGQPNADPATPYVIVNAFAASLYGVSSTPAALLAVQRTDPGDLVRVDLPGPYASVDVQVAGRGTVTAIHRDPATGTETVVLSSSFDTSPQSFPFPRPQGSVGALTSLRLTAPSPQTAPIDVLVISSGSGAPVVIGELCMHVMIDDYPGTLWAAVPSPQRIAAPAPPQRVAGIFRHREAVIDRRSGAPIPLSLYEVQCSAAPPQQLTGDPNSDPMDLPDPKVAIGYVAERRSSTKEAWRSLERIFGASGLATPKDSPLAGVEERVVRFTDAALRDPTEGWMWRVAAFELFGVRGAYSHASKPVGVELRPASPSTMRVVSFDNSSSGGGHPDVNRWTGGTLTVQAAWAGAELLANPDGRTARILAVPVADDGNEGPPIGSVDVDVPSPAPMRLVVSAIDTMSDAQQVTLTFDKPLPASNGGGALPGLLVLAGVNKAPASVAERFLVAPNGSDTVLISAGEVARVRCNTLLYKGGPAFFIPPHVIQRSIAVNLEVAATRRSARGRVRAIAGTKAPFDDAEQLVDPNTGAGAALPESTPASFIGQQWLQPPPPEPPVHPTHHVYFGVAGFDGSARRVLTELTLSADAAVSNMLYRAPVETVEMTDALRRRDSGVLNDVVPPGISTAGELGAWEAALGDWLDAYNQRTGSALTPQSIFDDNAARAAWGTHFFGGLLDEEVRGYADLAANRPAFSRVPSAAYGVDNAHPVDTVDGHGDSRYLHRISAFNIAGSEVLGDQCSGPSYVRPVLSPSTPGYLRADRDVATGSVQLTWPMTDSPHVGGYLLYAAGDPASLADLRFFGGLDPARPLPAASIADLLFDPSASPPLKWSGGTRDPRIKALIADPRLVARDYNDAATQPPGDVNGAAVAHGASDMAEMRLPQGVTLDEVLGVYRLSDWAPGNAATAQPGFNYWWGTTKQLLDGGRRLAGLRVGVGQPAFVVVVGRSAGAVVTRGSLPTVARPPDPPLPARIVQYRDPAAAAGTAYCVVAVDVFGNRSDPSPVIVAH